MRDTISPSRHPMPKADRATPSRVVATSLPRPVATPTPAQFTHIRHGPQRLPQLQSQSNPWPFHRTTDSPSPGPATRSFIHIRMGTQPFPQLPPDTIGGRYPTRNTQARKTRQMDFQPSISSASSSSTASNDFLLEEDGTHDSRTGLTKQSTTRHMTILRSLASFPGSLQKKLNAWWLSLQSRFTDPATLRTWVAASLGALKRAHVYGFTDRESVWYDPAIRPMILGWITALERRIRLEKPILTAQLELAEIRDRFIKAPTDEVRLFIALQVLSGGHRATSIERLQIRDTIFMSLETCRPLTLDEVNLSLLPTVYNPTRPRSLALVFRDTKTSGRIGTYTLHIHLPKILLPILIRVLLRNAARSSSLPPHKQFLFGERRATVRRASLPSRTLRRTLLRMLAMSGAPSSAVRLFSRHTDDAGLRTYLGAGLWQRDEANQTSPLSERLALMVL